MPINVTVLSRELDSQRGPFNQSVVIRISLAAIPNDRWERQANMTNRKLADIVKEQKPLMLAAHETVQQACRCMWEHRTGSVLVIDDQRRLSGIFTGRDAVRTLAEGKDAAVTPLAQAMTPNPVRITPECRAIDALRAMRAGGFRHLPVVEDGKILGIVSRGDFMGMEIDRLEEETHLWEIR